MRIEHDEISYSTDGVDLHGGNGKPLNVEAAVAAAISVYGRRALTAAAWCALNAHFDGRKEEYRLWADVFAELRVRSRAQPQSLDGSVLQQM